MGLTVSSVAGELLVRASSGGPATIGAVLVPQHGDPGAVPPLTWTSWATTWSFEPVPAVGIALAAAWYLLSVRRLRARGDRWSRGRTVAFLGGGLGTVALASQSFLSAYDTTLLTVHMAQHMLLTMVAPVLLGLGAPLTLALRTSVPRLRSGLLAVLHSRWLRIVGHPAVAGTLFVVTPWVLYFTPLYELTLRNGLVHDLNHAHFLAVGCLWFWSLVGVDPMPRASHVMRLLAVFVTLPFHAFLGLALMSQERILAADWYGSLGRDWGPTLSQDQYAAGGLLWITGDLVGVLVLAVLFVQWMRASEREARRVDRELDRMEARQSGPDALGDAATPPVESQP